MADEQNEFARPSPALTPAQRYYLDVFGYVVIENVLEQGEVERLLEAMYRLKRDLLATDEPKEARVRGCGLAVFRPHHLHFAHILETDPAIFDYLTHPRLVGMAEELVGGNVRLEESEAAINKRNPEEDLQAPARYGFHKGSSYGYGTHEENGLFHCNFVKTLTNLTELGPDDGGTVVIVGSHKMDCPSEDIIACAYADPTLIHQVVAPAGSTLLFSEALIHATGQVRSDRERVIVIGGYTPPMFQAWNGQEPSAAFIEHTPEKYKALISGSDKWSWKRCYRSLDMPTQE